MQYFYRYLWVMGTMGLLTLLSFPVELRSQRPVNPDALVLKDFEDRVAQYVKLRKQIEAKLPPLKPTESPEQIHQHEQNLAHLIQQGRRNAKQGDLFTAQVSKEMRRLIRMAMQGPNATLVRTSLKNAEPVHVKLQVNQVYPSTAPLQSTPPTLLLNLPTLPTELEYRVVGHALVLLDAKAGVIVDFIAEAID